MYVGITFFVFARLQASGSKFRIKNTVDIVPRDHEEDEEDAYQTLPHYLHTKGIDWTPNNFQQSLS